MSGYHTLAQFYDRLLTDDDTAARAEYLLSLFSRFGARPATLLDLACGSGRLTREFACQGIDMVGVDNSAEMLSEAAERCRGISPEVLLLCQDMRALDLNDTVDGAVCVFDGLNHLRNTEAIAETLRRLRLFVVSGGCFIFDVNTPYKHREILGDRDFVWEDEDLLCLWRNRYCAKTNEVVMELDFLEEQPDGRYARQSDTVCERAYTLPTWKRLLKENGWECLAVYGDRTTTPPTAEEQRWVIVARNTRPQEEYL